MRYALIMAGGSGTRLWPVSRRTRPKQMIRLGGGKSLIELALGRLDGLLPRERVFVCAGREHGRLVVEEAGLAESQFIGEPCGRDTLNAAALGAAVIARRDPDAIVAVLTADHVIEPEKEFRSVLARGFECVEAHPGALVTFGIAPSGPATGYGYLELGEAIGEGARRVSRFHEKPKAETAREYFSAGPERYLWNSGMFVWRAATLLSCAAQYVPKNHEGIARVAEAWDTPRREAVLDEVYPGLPKVSVDFAVMEPASQDPARMVAAVPMALQWLDVGSWPALARTCRADADGNAVAAGASLLVGSRGNLVYSEDPGHLVAVLGCENLVVIHTANATLVCPAERAEEVKALQAAAAQKGDAWV